MRVIFMGTPDFASEILRGLISSPHEICAVVSQPDKPKGRGHKLVPTDVKKTATEAGIEVFQPQTLKNGEMKPLLEKYAPDVIVVAAYGKILPEYIINYPKFGCVNVHASLLPKYRGAAPIQRAVINGDEVTGVTTMLMEKGLDTGDMLLKEETKIGEYETSQELFERLAGMGRELLLKTLDGLEKGEIVPEKQNDCEHTYAPMISKEEARIDWSMPVRAISKLICGMNSWPMAYTTYKGEPLKIIKARYEISGAEEAGKILALDKEKGLAVGCIDGRIYIEVARFGASKAMSVQDYANGHDIEIGIFLGR